MGDVGRLAGGDSRFGDLGPREDLLLLVSSDDCGVRNIVGVSG